MKRDRRSLNKRHDGNGPAAARLENPYFSRKTDQ